MSPSLTCANCGSPLPADARFCASCGRPVAPVGGGRAVRKVVTVLFADIAGSTRMGEALDPEAVRTLLGRHFAEARAILERHGGTVEKFIGDAVMAVFGIPSSHEDDAVRAVRAALELQERVTQLNADPALPTQLAIRIGINTGEVVTGSGAAETLVTGDTVNTAARLEQAAEPGEVLIGSRTLDLVGGIVQTETHPPIDAKGKARPLEAARVLRATGDEGTRRSLISPIVGREQELLVLREVFDRTASEATPQLVTLVAAAGVGKSRLVREFRMQLESRATVLTGRCLAYGDGITYWPVREVIHQLADVHESDGAAGIRERLASAAGDQRDLVDALAAVIGLEAPSQGQEELFWAIRKLLELASAQRPVVVVLEDLHWAEPTLLDLVEYLATTATGALLLVATARPELLDTRAEWGREVGSLLRLAALDRETAGKFMDGQVGARELPQDVRERILEAAEGNPLFLEEMVAMVRDGDETSPADLTVPPTIHALLAARLDQLHERERSVLEHGSVIGRAFEVPAIVAIGSDDVVDGLGRSLLALVRRELIRPDRPEITSADAYRFRHVLIRDAAYQSLSKSERARLHEGVASWMEDTAGERIGEYEALVAWHLEQSLGYRQELGEDARELEVRTARWMLRAGLRASHRDESAAAITHLRKAAKLGMGEYELASKALEELSYLFQITGAYAEAESAVDQAHRMAVEAGNARDAAVAVVNRAYARRHTRSATWAEEATTAVPIAIAALEAAGDDANLAAAWQVLGIAYWPDRVAESDEARNRALAHARRSGDPRWLGWTIAEQVTDKIADTTPVTDSIAAVADMLGNAPSLGRFHRAAIDCDLAVLEAAAGRYDDALLRLRAAQDTMRQVGDEVGVATSAIAEMAIHEHGGRPELAVDPLSSAIAFMDRTADTELAPYLRAHLARILAILGRIGEAEAMLERADDLTSMHEIVTRSARSRILSARGEHDASISEARAALALIPERSLIRRAWTLGHLAHALARADRPEEARQTYRAALELADRKGDVALHQLLGEELRSLDND